MRNFFLCGLLILISTNICAIEPEKQYVTNYSMVSKEKTAEGIFNKICLDGVIYWLYSASTPNNVVKDEGGLTPYINPKTLTYKRCKITTENCQVQKNKLGLVTNKSKMICYKQFIEIE